MTVLINNNNNKLLTHNGKLLIAPEQQIGIPRDVNNYTFQYPTSNFIFRLPNNVTNISSYTLYYAFINCTTITEVDFNNPNTEMFFGEYALEYAFKGCTNLTTISNLKLPETITGRIFESAFNGCTSLTDVSFLSRIKAITGSSSFSIAFANTGITSLDLSNLENTIGSSGGLSQAFSSCHNLTTVDLRKLTTIDNSFLYMAFSRCENLSSVNLSSLTTVGSNCLYWAFLECTSLTSMPLTELTTVSGSSAMYYAFKNCTGLTGTLNFSKLKTINGWYAFYGAFGVSAEDLNYITSVSFPVLDTLTGSNALKFCFEYRTALTSISFPALTSTSFGSDTDQFNSMIRGITGCTVHFPSNLQSIIGGWNDVIAGFGGTNTTVLFDLAATE